MTDFTNKVIFRHLLWKWAPEEDEPLNENHKKDYEKVVSHFKKWREWARGQERIRDEFSKMLRLKEKRSDDTFDMLISHVIVACFFATNSSIATPDSLNQLKEKNAYEENIKIQLPHIQKLANAILEVKNNQHHQFYARFFSRFVNAFLEKRGYKVEELIFSDEEANEFIIKMLRGYEFQLKTWFPWDAETWPNTDFREITHLEGGPPWFKTKKAGALLYHDQLHKQVNKTNRSVNSLIFHLAFLFRQYTSSRLDDISFSSFGGQMPNDGKPCYEHVTNIANAIFTSSGDFCDSNDELDEGKVKDRIRGLVKNEVRLGCWLKDES